ncbi:unnamed protein product [Paramecium sonneborni]|uniref:tRNA N(3)-methylcytidine methyltransferase n=1 Tax=Paramecium sonneborni TaxID=65129 RepID=A0A8S1KJX0_9CILI|nr:unnamed protein product [Paramecium sonneborni]
MDPIQKKQKIGDSDGEEIIQEGEVDENFEQRVQKLLYETDNGLNLYNKPVMPLIYYEFNEEIKQQAEQVINQDKTILPQDKYEKYEKEASKIWDKFYRHHQNNFFKDRHYLEREIPELNNFKESHQKDETKLFIICEMGCGVGNALFPLKKNYTFFKKVYGFDFSKRAIDVLKTNELYDETVYQACVCDLVLDPLPDFERPDLGTLIFVLSAISPENHLIVVRKIYEWMKPGSVLYFRDYGQYDFGQINLSKKQNRKLKDNFYVKHDGVRVYYFSNQEVTSLFTTAGFKQLDIKAHYRYIENRKTKVKMYRVWVQGRFLKE